MRRTLFNPGPDALVFDTAGHQTDPGLFVGDTGDDVTQAHIQAGRLLDKGPADEPEEPTDPESGE